MPNDLITLANAKDYLKLTSTTDDELLKRLIAAASSFLLAQMNRREGLDHDYLFTKGFAEVPADVEFACCELVGLRYKEKDRVGEVSKSIKGETVSFSQKDISAFGRAVINQYKRVTP